MAVERPKFSFVVHFYFGVFLILLAICPIAAAERIAEDKGSALAHSPALLILPGILAVMFWYAHKRCSSEQMVFRDGLLWVTASTMTGWVYMSFVTVLPSLLAALFGSVFFALAGDARRDPKYAATKWIALVKFFYRNRMRR
jgi:CDP-diglyceride synthetase